jgi:hypothetical protein
MLLRFFVFLAKIQIKTEPFFIVSIVVGRNGGLFQNRLVQVGNV